MSKNYYLWIEIEANRKRILDENYFDCILNKCAENGFDSIILGVKDTGGFGIYNSKIVPHYSKFDKDFRIGRDYLEIYIKKAHDKGLKIYAAIDLFSEGRKNTDNILSPAVKHKEWQTELYGINEKGEAVIKPITSLEKIKTLDSIDDFMDIFVNPVRKDVQDYELSVVKELAQKYDLDGIVLDRVRFVGLGADFSDYTRLEFEKYIGFKVENWPFDIYKLSFGNDSLKINYGKLFEKWITFRSKVIKEFIIKVRNTIDSLDKNIEFIDYTGSWYPIYYQVGANFASETYKSNDSFTSNDEYSKTGYAEYVDKLLSGFYYPDVTIEEALKAKKPYYWYSVEGSGVISEEVVKGKTPIIGSLYVKQYENDPEKFIRAINMCFEKSQGCMIFDLCYIDDYKWWSNCKIKEEIK